MDTHNSEPPESGRGPSLFRDFLPKPPEHAGTSDRLAISSTELYPILQSEDAFLKRFRQLRLMDEAEFVKWASKRDVPITGSVIGRDVDELWKRGWLRADEIFLVPRHWRRRYSEAPIPVPDRRAIGARRPLSGRWHEYSYRLHPFRVYPVIHALGAMEWRLVRSNVMRYATGVRQYADRYVRSFHQHTRSDRWHSLIDWWNGIADLAILLEPLYWSEISGQLSGTSMVALSRESTSRVASSESAEYRRRALSTFQRIPKEKIAEAHMQVRYCAVDMDNNSELYLLIRAALWHKRQELEGRIGGALWLRHIAEVLRRAYDEVYSDRLVHEDEGYGQQFVDARKFLYGSEYPLDNPRELVRRVLPRWGVSSGVRVRFYVEGDTEQGALEEGMASVIGYGVEVVNLQAQGWSSWLRRELKNDVRAKRFSYFMLDSDREDPIRSIRALARENLIWGEVYINKPDFECGCFTVEQLCQAISIYEQAMGFVDIAPLDVEIFNEVESGTDLDARYQTARKAPSLKSKSWGAALALVAFKSRTSIHDESNKLVRAIASAVRALRADYEATRKTTKLDPETLKLIDTGESLLG